MDLSPLKEFKLLQIAFGDTNSGSTSSSTHSDSFLTMSLRLLGVQSCQLESGKFKMHLNQTISFGRTFTTLSSVESGGNFLLEVISRWLGCNLGTFLGLLIVYFVTFLTTLTQIVTDNTRSEVWHSYSVWIEFPYKETGCGLLLGRSAFEYPS